ncbi:MAG: hypothetical protein J7J31_03090 [Helicobacteraceae bacterium]|nr:hypothetical protein [Helicobacteraceae bacterium]
MGEFKLKLILVIVGGLAFSFVFILLAFAIPLDKERGLIKKPKGVLEEVSHSLRNKGKD